MSVMRLGVLCVILSASSQAAAFDAARCAETRRYIAQLEQSLSRGPAASDRAAYEQALTAYRKVEPVFCGNSPAAGNAPGGMGGMGGSSRAASAAEALGALAGILQVIRAALPEDDAAYRPIPSGPALPAPPPSTGSVTGAMTMQRLGGGPVQGSGASSPLPQPTVAATQPMQQRLAPGAPSPFPTDQQIGLRCATAVNPSMCELALQNQRNQDPAYRQWKATEAARMDRNIDKSMANIDAAVAASTQSAAHQVIPRLPPPQPYDNSDPDLARCRDGEKAPWTIAGCYDLGAARPAAKPVQGGNAGKDSNPDGRTSLREQLRRSLNGEDDDDDAAKPSRDPENEKKQLALWKARAAARLLEAMRQGKAVVPENIQERDACEGFWLYDGFGPGTCSPWNRQIVYEVDVPAVPQQVVAAPPAKDEPFSMDAAETEREVRRLTQPLPEPEVYGPPSPDKIQDRKK